MKLISIAALACLLLAACSPPQPAAYTPEYELNFMRACQAGGASTAVCACVWGKIEAEVPVSDFLAFEALPAGERATHPITTQLATISQSCAPAAAPTPEPASEGTAP